MKNIIRAFIYALLGQIFCWGTFFLIDNYVRLEGNVTQKLALAIGMLLLTILLYLFFKFDKKIVEKHNLDFKKFNISFIIFWLLLTAGVSAFVLKYIDTNMINECLKCRNQVKEGHICECYLFKIEYEFYAMFLVVVDFICAIWNILEIKKMKKVKKEAKSKEKKKSIKKKMK